MADSATFAFNDDNTAGAGSTRRADERIYESIRHAVLTQKLPPGSRLPEITLSEIYGVSRSVVRKALVRLAADQIVVMKRNQIARVIRPSQDETREIFDARRLIEGEVMRLTAGRLPAEIGARLATIMDEEHDAHERADHETRIHLSLAFHQLIADHCPNRILARVLRELILRTSVAVALYKVSGMGACYRGRDHRRIATALMDGDGDEAGRLAVNHLDELESQLALGDVERPVDLAEILRKR